MRPVLQADNWCIRFVLRRVPVMGQFLDVVHEAVEQPLPVHLRAAAEREAIEALVVAHVPEHWLDGRKALAVARAALGRIDARFRFADVVC